MSGRVSVRPVRVAHALDLSLNDFRLCVNRATSAWGGIYHVLATQNDAEELALWAGRRGVDIIYPATRAKKSLGNIPGFAHVGYMHRDLFGSPDNSASERLLGPEIGYSNFSNGFIFPQWDSDDPLCNLYAAWYGQYGESDYDQALQNSFTGNVSTTVFPPNVEAKFPYFRDEWLSPIELTASGVEYHGAWNSVGFVVVDPNSPLDLINLWNLRACGHRVFPWAIGFGDRFKQSAQAWLENCLRGASPPGRVKRGDGVDLGFSIATWIGRDASAIPNDLQALLEDFDDIHATAEDPEWQERGAGWRGSHPLHTEFARSFSTTVGDKDRQLTVSLPALPYSTNRGTQLHTRIVAAQVRFYRESGLDPELTFFMPNVRMLAQQSPSLRPEIFHRPTAEGRAIGVRCDKEALTIDVMSVPSMVDQLFSNSRFKTGRSDSGRFATRLIGMLGGTRSSMGNQPAVRFVLDDAARTPNGRPIARLIRTAADRKGGWPGTLSRNPDDYPKNVVYQLLSRKLLRPVLPVRCPSCATTTYFQPEDLAVAVACDMCGRDFPLGFALGIEGRPVDWHYRAARSLTAESVAETMSLLACLGVLTTSTNGDHELTASVLGLTVSEGKKWSCEIDIAFFVNSLGAPHVIIGEAKSHRDSISADDMANLARVQEYLRSRSIECFVMATTLRERLEEGEVSMLRKHCEQVQLRAILRHDIRPVLPIVLTGKDLSSPYFHDNHPSTWGRITSDLVELAEESCKRNLDLTGISYAGWSSDQYQWRLSWGDPVETSAHACGGCDK